jgi:prepilin-type N-terminal cleavage/methylation domain-containing protein
MKTRRDHRGFTLLELILALAMVSVLTLTLYTALMVTVRAKERAYAAVAPVRTTMLAADIVRQDLESVLPCKQLLAGPFIGTSQNGADVLDFYCLGSDVGWHAPPTDQQTQQQPGRGGGMGQGLGLGLAPVTDAPWSDGPRHVVLELRTDLQPPSLVRSVTRNLLAPTQPEPEEEVLVRNVKSFTLRYFDGSVWQDNWDSTTLGDILPVAVEMTLETVTEDEKPGQPATTYKVTRVFPLACAEPPTDTTGGGQ